MNEAPDFSFEGASPDDRALFDRVRGRHIYSSWDLSRLDAEALAAITSERGIDFATALLFDRIIHDPRHGPSVNRIENLRREEAPETIPLDATLAIVPGAFYKEYPHTGADGDALRRSAEEFGVSTELIPTLSAGGPLENARMVCDWLKRARGRKVILASLSRGGAEVKLALNQPDAAQAFENVAAWINFGGILRGSPMWRWILDRRLARWFYLALFRMKGFDTRPIHDTARGPGCALNFDAVIPDHLRVIHVMGFPLERHTSGARARRWYRRLTPMGPNDSVSLLADASSVPGLIYPVWGVDHYIQSGWEPDKLVPALLRFCAEESLPDNLARESVLDS